MLVSDLKKIIDIDNRISQLHRELAGLYSRREQCMRQSNLAGLKNIPAAEASQTSQILSQNSNADWLNLTYEHLKNIWSYYGIKIPSSRRLQRGLAAALEAINKISAEHTELTGKLGVLLIPPTQILGQPGENNLRKKQSFISLEDYFDGQLAKRYLQRKWRLIVVYQEPVPLNFGKAKDIISSKKYLLAGYDGRALGVYEYYALSLQSTVPLDQTTWTLLLKGYKLGSKTVASVTYINGQYRFEVDDSDNVFGDERFRPAVEVASI